MSTEEIHEKYMALLTSQDEQGRTMCGVEAYLRQRRRALMQQIKAKAEERNALLMELSELNRTLGLDERTTKR